MDNLSRAQAKASAWSPFVAQVRQKIKDGVYEQEEKKRGRIRKEKKRSCTKQT